jgi:hypothetical protein
MGDGGCPQPSSRSLKISMDFAGVLYCRNKRRPQTGRAFIRRLGPSRSPERSTRPRQARTIYGTVPDASLGDSARAEDEKRSGKKLCSFQARSSLTYSHSHRRAGIGTCFLTMTHARLRRSPSNSSNSGAAHGDGSAVGEGEGAASGINGRDQLAFCG